LHLGYRSILKSAFDQIARAIKGVFGSRQFGDAPFAAV